MRKALPDTNHFVWQDALCHHVYPLEDILVYFTPVWMLCCILSISDSIVLAVVQVAGSGCLHEVTPPLLVQCQAVSMSGAGVALQHGVRNVSLMQQIKSKQIVFCCCCCSVSELSATSGLPRAALLNLLAKYPALSSLGVSGLMSGLEELSGLLEVTLSDVLDLVTRQPTLLIAKVNLSSWHAEIFNCFCRCSTVV